MYLIYFKKLYPYFILLILLLLWPFKDILNHMGTPWGVKSYL
jgi:hypothetical protein